MNETNKLALAKEWIDKAEQDFSEAKFLFAHDRALENVALFIEQAAEKSLKGYLIAQGWKLKKTHDITTLLAEAEKYNEQFSRFSSIAPEITEYYLDSRYPGESQGEYTREEIERSLTQVEELLHFVKQILSLLQ